MQLMGIFTGQTYNSEAAANMSKNCYRRLSGCKSKTTVGFVQSNMNYRQTNITLRFDSDKPSAKLVAVESASMDE